MRKHRPETRVALRAHRHLGGAERSPHPPKQDRVSHGIRSNQGLGSMM